MDGAHQPPEQRTAVRIPALAEQPAGEERNDEHCNDQRADDGGDHGDGKHSDEFPRIAGQRHQREEGEDQGGRASHDGDKDLAGARQCSLRARGACAQVTRDILGHHDRVIDQQSERDDEGRNRDLVQGVAEKVQRREPERKGQRYRDHDDAGGAPP